MNPDMILGSSPALISPCLQVVAQATQISMVPEWPRDTNMDGPRWRPRPLANAQTLIVSKAKNINTDPGCNRITDPDIALN